MGVVVVWLKRRQIHDLAEFSVNRNVVAEKFWIIKYSAPKDLYFRQKMEWEAEKSN